MGLIDGEGTIYLIGNPLFVCTGNERRSVERSSGVKLSFTVMQPCFWVIKLFFKVFRLFSIVL